MPRLRFLLAYDGRPYAGWQSQPDRSTVQDTLELAIGKILTSPPPRVTASGRTDAGVHALGQVVYLDVPNEKPLPAAAWTRALNVHLPPTIRVLVSEYVPDTFHSRFQATGKTYRYRLWTGPILPPFEAGLALHYPRPLDFALLTSACTALIGTHDFSNFAAFRGNEDGTEDYTRTLYAVTPVAEGDLITITFCGSGFLYKMVRLLTGALLRVATGRETLAWLSDLIHLRSPVKCSHVAPADGLYLVHVEYPDTP